MTIANVTGWNYLFDGKLVEASFSLYDTALAGWTVGILFLIFQFMLIVKTRNLPLAFTMGAIFFAMYAGSVFIKSISSTIIVVILVLELVGIFYYAFKS